MSHGGVLSLFGSEVVTEGEATPEQDRFLTRLSKLRKQADYEYGPIESDVEQLSVRAREFVSNAESLVSE